MNIPVLDPIELRVLGCLVEKSKTTPDYYPMTIHGLTAACNQKTSRKPVVQYHEETVSSALNSLKKRNLVATSFEGSGRVLKYKHQFGVVFPIVPAETTLLCLLILRGPQTPGELNTNSARMHEYDSLEEIIQLLDKLSAPEMPLIEQLPRRPGQKEVRFAHLLGGPIVYDTLELIASTGDRNSAQLDERVTSLESELKELKASVGLLKIALDSRGEP